MRTLRFLLPLVLGYASAVAQETTATVTEVRSGLARLAIDPSQTYRVRELQLTRGGVKIYLTEGFLAFAAPIHGRCVAAVFTTNQVDAGDAEILALPPNAAERASLASFTGSPNLNEHFTSAVFFFGDDTADELLTQMRQRPLHPAPEIADSLAKTVDEALRTNGAELDVRLIAALVGEHRPEHGFFYAMIAGRTNGLVDFAFQPDQPDTVTLGRLAPKVNEPGSYFQIWSSFRPRNAPPFAPAANMLNDYQIEATIHDNLTMSAEARFDYIAQAGAGRVISLLLTSRLQPKSAFIDGKSAEVYQHPTPFAEAERAGAAPFLIVSPVSLSPGTHHRVQLFYDGSIIHKTGKGTYFVDERNAWYPFSTPLRANFDLTFHCPAKLRLVATGDLISEDVSAGVRTVHLRTPAPQALAGFNLGEYTIESSVAGSYRIDVYSNLSTASPAGIPAQTAAILQRYTSLWGALPLHVLAVSPIEGYFGQGFPGLIYLSDVTYTLERDRPPPLRNPRIDSFFTQMLLPHEVAHQWWGNIVAPADYRANWILEALANFVAIQYLEVSVGKTVADEILSGYRDQLSSFQDGKPVDSAGPVVFGERLLNNYGVTTWHQVLYEKGTWIFQMLRRRLGDAAFAELLRRLLKDYSAVPIGNEDLRQEAAALLPAGSPDPTLNAFFETWVYGTGIPTLSITDKQIILSQVPEDYLLDIPLNCRNPNGVTSTRWLKISAGSTSLPAPNCRLPDRTAFLYH